MIKGVIPSAFRPALQKLVPPLELEFHNLKEFTVPDEYIYWRRVKHKDT